MLYGNTIVDFIKTLRNFNVNSRVSGPKNFRLVIIVMLSCKTSSYKVLL